LNSHVDGSVGGEVCLLVVAGGGGGGGGDEREEDQRSVVQKLNAARETQGNFFSV